MNATLPHGTYGLYIHIPFCEHKCGYCDFYSATNIREFGNKFVEAVNQEIFFRASSYKSKMFDTIFIGGGTPSLLSLAQLELLFNTIWKYYQISSDAEITIEANPGTVNKEKLQTFFDLGINRVSFGVQSFRPEELYIMERNHTASDVLDNVSIAQKVGFQNISLDLIFSLPKQSLQNWMFSLEQAISLNISHISAYNLIFERNTPFYSYLKEGTFSQNDDSTERVLYQEAINFLEQNGFSMYEVSNFSKGSIFESKHNKKYWTHQPYLGFGPSAHSFDGRRKRWWNIRSTEKYIRQMNENKVVISGEEELTDYDLSSEMIMLGLRMTRGISLLDYQKKLGCDFYKKYEQTVEKFIDMRLMEINDSFCFLTKEGIFYCDEIIRSF